MAYILDLNQEIKRPEESQALKRCFEAYKHYLRALGDRLPPGVRDFVLSDWYWDYNSHKCPYDGWVECVEVREPASGERHQNRTVEIKLRILGPYHSGHIEYTYRNVQEYSMVLPNRGQERQQVGHDGWQADEVRLSEGGKIIHEIVFKSHARWMIESETIEYTWVPLPASISHPLVG